MTYSWNKLMEKINTLSPVELVMLALGFLLIAGLLLAWRLGAKRKPIIYRGPMHLSLHSFQVAPLGRDAILRIHNHGEAVVLVSANIKKNRDIGVVNVLSGHDLLPGKTYGILLEVRGKDRMLPDFELELTYVDSHRNVFRQSFFPEMKGAKKARRIRKA
jgi:hypothetical protein